MPKERPIRLERSIKTLDIFVMGLKQHCGIGLQTPGFLSFESARERCRVYLNLIELHLQQDCWPFKGDRHTPTMLVELNELETLQMGLAWLLDCTDNEYFLSHDCLRAYSMSEVSGIDVWLNRLLTRNWSSPRALLDRWMGTASRPPRL